MIENDMDRLQNGSCLRKNADGIWEYFLNDRDLEDRLSFGKQKENEFFKDFIRRIASALEMAALIVKK